MQDIYQEITDKIIEQIETGNALPWVRPWSVTGWLPKIPVNMDGKPYSGINVVILWDHRYISPVWGTYKAIQAKGGQVRKGERGTKIVFFKKLNIKERDQETGEEKDKNIPLLRTYTVFNAEQCDGLELPKLTEIREPVTGNDIQPIEEIETYIRNTGADVRHGGEQAYYMPSDDHIQMPMMEKFTTDSGYYATLLHELTHWTGSKKRLERKKGIVFGDKDYAFEELIAELGAAFQCAELGIQGEQRHANYIQSWLKALKSDKKFIFQAAAKANQACQYIKDKQLQDWTIIDTAAA